MNRLLLLFALTAFSRALLAESLTLTTTISLPGVKGRIDHIAFDSTQQHLFVAALGNNTVEVVDLKEKKVVYSIDGLDEPQGIAFVPELNALYVANGGDGTLRVYDGGSFAALAVLKFAGDADNVRYNADEKKIYVGYGSGGIGIVDVTKNAIVGDIPLSAHPESFQFEQKGPRIFVNVPKAHGVAVLDRAKKKQIGKWSLGLAAANFPMALDESTDRAFIGCRMPARLLVFDLNSGKEDAKLDLHGDCDDVFFDPLRKQIYASCGEGFIDIFSKKDSGEYVLKEAIKTIQKARTCYFDGDNIYLAVPKIGAASAEIRWFTLAR